MSGGRHRKAPVLRKPADPPRSALRYVVQKHAARTLHYDFRLEVDGVLRSWAVPKGPSTDPRVKRLAIPTEDHNLEYATFEGVIPEGQYGAGAVIVWDIGTYRPVKGKGDAPGTMAQALARGRAAFRIAGKKLRGGYILIRARRRGAPRWLLAKMKDAEADPGRDPVRTEPESVLTGLTVEEVAAGGEWRSDTIPLL